ncbi:MAG: Crp/Fnr family transcriptional regulator [Oligoflexia bacterium]|nr:Crp/Fnr family transcriptional regulator [Oligoflexia bacterium]MBF0365806.1 Crp/Fnr family transcriptional regulator [Oligoflexia bacterium]
MEQKSKLDVQKFLSSIFLFENLGSEDVDLIVKGVKSKKLKRNQILFNEGQKADAFYIVVYGKLAVTKLSKSGGERPLHYHGDRDVIAEAAIFDSEFYPASCVALKESMVLQVLREEFVGVLLRRPEVAIKMLAAYSRRLRGFVNMIEYLTLDGVRERLIKYMVKNCISNDEGIGKDRKCTIHLKMSKKELALILGTVPETLSRTLRQLNEEGVLREVSHEQDSTLFELSFESVKDLF